MCDVLCDCPTGKSLKPVQPSREKYSASRSPQITPTTPAIPRPEEGRIAIVTDVGCGERWPRHAGRARSFRRVSLLMSEGRAPTNGVIADGKAVWFWRPLLASSRRRFCEIQPGFAKTFNPPATEARGIRLRGEHGISRKPIAQGMPGCSGCTCMLVCASSSANCTRDRGCQPAPGIPCALLTEGETMCKSSGAIAPREGEGVLFSPLPLAGEGRGGGASTQRTRRMKRDAR